ncbi:MAG: DUF1549 domain-containing protein [Gemmataceae bacterium]
MTPPVYPTNLAKLVAAVFGAMLLFRPAVVRTAEPVTQEKAAVVARTIDRLLDEHWRRERITPTAVAHDTALFRRLTLDLAGRIPTAREIERFNADSARDKYARTVHQLLDGPEFSWHFGAVLDDMIQGPFAGNSAFLNYLRTSLRDGKSWDSVFREMMLGPWDTKERKPAAAFLARRAKDLDRLTADVTRSFFGVNISCARCHNHPLVKDWKREHYYGMAAFLVRTTGGKGAVSEKNEGEARFAGKDGKERIVPMMFLSGRKPDERAQSATGTKGKKISRREVLVRLALEDGKFLSRAFVNRMWEYFLGRGLVDPVDQIHSGNPASVPALLDALAADFLSSGYDIRRLIAGIVLSRAYRLDSRWTDSATAPDAKHFAVARLRPLSSRQLAASLVIALGDGRFEPTSENLTRLEKQTTELAKHLDSRTREFQSSTGEALFLSNSATVRKLVAADGDNLTARLAALREDRALVKAAFTATLGRSPTAAESERLVHWLRRSGHDRRTACEDMAWALVTSAEFRFNH